MDCKVLTLTNEGGGGGAGGVVAHMFHLLDRRVNS